MEKIKRFIQESLYAHKWLLIIFYVGGVLGLLNYAYTYVQFIYYLMAGNNAVLQYMMEHELNQKTMFMLTVIDMIMFANLAKMINTGSYQSFVEKVPEKTEKVSSGLLKVKMATSLIGITGIHLLQVFLEPPKDNRELYIKIGTHIVFVLSAMALSWIDVMHSKSELYEAKAELAEHEGVSEKYTNEEVHI